MPRSIYNSTTPLDLIVYGLTPGQVDTLTRLYAGHDRVVLRWGTARLVRVVTGHERGAVSADDLGRLVLAGLLDRAVHADADIYTLSERGWALMALAIERGLMDDEPPPPHEESLCPADPSAPIACAPPDATPAE